MVATTDIGYSLFTCCKRTVQTLMPDTLHHHHQAQRSRTSIPWNSYIIEVDVKNAALIQTAHTSLRRLWDDIDIDLRPIAFKQVMETCRKNIAECTRALEIE